MRFLDNEGRLFGLLHPIDAAVILIVIIAAIAGAIIIAPNGGDSQTMEVQFSATGVESYVANSTETGPVPSNSEILAIENKSVSLADNQSESNMELWTRSSVTVREGLYYFNGERIFVGRTIQLDLGNVVIEGTVTNIENTSATAQ